MKSRTMDEWVGCWVAVDRDWEEIEGVLIEYGSCWIVLDMEDEECRRERKLIRLGARDEVRAVQGEPMTHYRQRQWREIQASRAARLRVES